MEYLRIDPRIDEHPDIVEVGFIGATVFQVVLRACASFDKRGRLPFKFSAAWLARRLGLTTEDTSLPPETFVQMGVDRCVKAGLLLRDDEGLIIPGWERFYQEPASGSDRTKKWRGKSKSVTARDACDDGDVCDATPLTHSPTPPTHSQEYISGDAEVPLLTPEEAKVTSSVTPVMKRYVEAMAAQGFRVKDTPGRRELVKKRLEEGWSVEDLLRAVDGFTYSDWHMARDPKNPTPYTDLDYCLGDDKAIEKFIAMEEAQNVPRQLRRL